jgi:hypothetical protein
MITAIVAALCALYFAYVKKWAESYLSREYQFGSPAPPDVLPHSSPLSILVAIVFGILLLRLFSSFDLTTLFIVAALTLSYFIVYRLGEMSGVAHMKSTVLFTNAMGDPKT